MLIVFCCSPVWRDFRFWYVKFGRDGARVWSLLTQGLVGLCCELLRALFPSKEKKTIVEANIKVNHSSIESTLWWRWGDHEGVVIVNSGVGGHILRVPEGPTQDLIWNAQKSAPPKKQKNTNTHTHKKCRAECKGDSLFNRIHFANPWESTAAYQRCIKGAWWNLLGVKGSAI